MHLMHHMHGTGSKQGKQGFPMNYRVYCWLRLEEHVIWEQEVGGSNPLDPTKYIIDMTSKSAFFVNLSLQVPNRYLTPVFDNFSHFLTN